MEGEGENRSEGRNDSMLQNSPFDNENLFNRHETDMVVEAVRKNSLNTTEAISPLLPEEKKVNISNLSDLVPEEQLERISDTPDEFYNRVRRAGSLNEVQEVDEDISDDMRPTSPTGDVPPAISHESADSATILDMQ